MDNETVVVAEMRAKPGQEEELKRRTVALVEPTRREAGCVQYDLHVSDTDPASVLFYEVWVSREALDQHLKTPHLTGFVSRAEECLAAPIKITTFTRIV